jgi:regulator of replication initiation timing
LQRLRDIADNRMPSVADLLSQGAKAPGKKAAANAQAKSKTGPQAGNNKGTQAGEPGEAKKNDQPPQPAVPKLTDTESGFNKQNAVAGEKEEAKAGKSKFGLPTTVLQGGPPSDDKQKPETPAEEKVEEAVEEQTELLAEFEKVREDLQKIMDDLENSTFVKRFKAASREQLEVATALNRTLFDGFGVSGETLNQSQKDQTGRIADREVAQSQKVRDIQDDLEAYYDRRKEEKFMRILQEMQELKVVKKLNNLSEKVRLNRHGDSIARAEYWGDTLDRWGEELVSASKCGT